MNNKNDNSVMTSTQKLSMFIELFRVHYGITVKNLAEELNVKPWILYDARRRMPTKSGDERSKYILWKMKDIYPDEYRTIQRYIAQKTYGDIIEDNEDIYK